jgi:hypothetical protein
MKKFPIAVILLALSCTFIPDSAAICMVKCGVSSGTNPQSVYSENLSPETVGINEVNGGRVK